MLGEDGPEASWSCQLPSLWQSKSCGLDLGSEASQYPLGCDRLLRATSEPLHFITAESRDTCEDRSRVGTRVESGALCTWQGKVRKACRCEERCLIRIKEGFLLGA